MKNTESIKLSLIIGIIDYIFNDLSNEESQIIENILQKNSKALAFAKNVITIIEKANTSKVELLKLLFEK